MSMGGGNKSGDINARREREAKAIAEATLRYQRENDERNRQLAQQAAADAINREKGLASTYRQESDSFADTFLSRLESALSTDSTARSGIYAGLAEEIEAYRQRSDGIATRSAQEATDYMLRNEDNFINFANALTRSAFDMRQQMVADTNPYQIAQQTQAAKNNLDMLSGRLPADVMAKMQRDTAYTALAGGFGADSSMGRAAQARNLGLTSLDLMGFADQSAQNWAKTIYDTQIAGLQVTSGQVADALGVKASDVMNVNQANNVGVFAAQRDLANSKLTGLANALSTRTSAYNNIFQTNMDAAARRYTGGVGTSDNAANLLGAQYRTSSTVMGAALSDYGNQRQSINSTAWQNELQQVRDTNAGWGSLITGLATAGGAIAGTVLFPGLGTAAGASLGATVGGSLGSAAAGGMGFSSSNASYAPVQSNASTSNQNSLWSNALGSLVTGGLNSSTGFYGSATGAAKAFGVDSSLISRNGIGQYYYNPGFVYGRGAALDRSFIR